MNKENVERLVHELLVEIGEDPSREGLVKTPHRFAKAMEFLTRGYSQDPEEVINKAVFETEANNMIIVRDIEVYSLCEHHILPFYGKCHVGYIPNDKVFGVSKICRLVDLFARRLQIQERLTFQIAQEINDHIGAQGVGVVLECRHLCKMMRGVEKQNSVMTTSSMLGCFHDEAATRSEFLSLISRKIN